MTRVGIEPTTCGLKERSPIGVVRVNSCPNARIRARMHIYARRFPRMDCIAVTQSVTQSIGGPFCMSDRLRFWLLLVFALCVTISLVAQLVDRGRK
jgi:hypothetical protein